MSKLMMGLAMAVGLAAGAAIGQVPGKPEAVPGGPPEAAAKIVPASPGSRDSDSSSGRRTRLGGGASNPLSPARSVDPEKARVGAMVDSLVRQYDKNGDGVIDKDEMNSMRVGPSLLTFDRNGDGKITREELTAYIMSPRRGGEPPSGPSSAFPGGRSGFSSGVGSRPEPAIGKVSGGFGGGPLSIPSKRPFEPPDPREAMVAIQAVLVELAQDEAVKAPEGRPDPASRGKSEPAVIDLDLAAPQERILAELAKRGVHGRLDVLNRLQITTLDKQRAYVQFGRQEPFISGVTMSTFGQTNNVTPIQTGLIVSITPRTAPGDAVILEIDLGESRAGRVEEGTPIFVSAKGETIRQPSIHTTTLQSVVKVPNGKTLAVVAATSESGPRRTETLLLVSAHSLSVKGD